MQQDNLPLHLRRASANPTLRLPFSPHTHPSLFRSCTRSLRWSSENSWSRAGTTRPVSASSSGGWSYPKSPRAPICGRGGVGWDGGLEHQLTSFHPPTNLSFFHTHTHTQMSPPAPQPTSSTTAFGLNSPSLVTPASSSGSSSASSLYLLWGVGWGGTKARGGALQACTWGEKQEGEQGRAGRVGTRRSTHDCAACNTSPPAPTHPSLITAVVTLARQLASKEAGSSAACPREAGSSTVRWAQRGAVAAVRSSGAASRLGSRHPCYAHWSKSAIPPPSDTPQPSYSCPHALTTIQTKRETTLPTAHPPW